MHAPLGGLHVFIYDLETICDWLQHQLLEVATMTDGDGGDEADATPTSLKRISKPTTYKKFPILIRSLDLQMQARNLTMLTRTD